VLKVLEWIESILSNTIEVGARRSARRFGRRSVLAKMGNVLMGGITAAVLPFDRGWGATPPTGDSVNDDKSCDYWRYCALDGLLCTTAGGTRSSCPVGAEASLVSWVGTCHNPGDNRDYLISYYDCCGKTAFSGAQFCLHSEGERPAYAMGLHNDINWCMANANKGYHCTVAVVAGLVE